ncbi:MAG: DUF1552 domain-containing protein [Pirellulales bacterium]
MRWHRRQFLRAAGVSLALPYLERYASADESGSKAPPRRLVCICAPLGFYPPDFFPEKAGAEYEASEYLQLLQDLRGDYSVISGLTHTGNSPGFAHQATASFLTGAPGAGRPGFRNSISLDQFAAERIGGETRYPSLVLSGEGLGLSWTRTGAQIPADNSPSRVFARLFLDGDPAEVQSQLNRLAEGRSILDDVRDQAAGLRGELGRDDREKLDEYLVSVRELEKRMARDEVWRRTPKPQVDAKPPVDIANAADVLGRARLMFDLTHLAIRTDSTRLITIMLPGSTYAPPIPGVSLGHHDLSHHGKDPGKLAQLKIVESETMKTVGELLRKLKENKEGESNLLDRTSVFLGSNLGDASSHSVRNLPVLLAGGGFRHGNHLAFNPDDPPPLCNLYVSLLQRLGIETDQFGNGTSTLRGLEFSS